MSDQNYRWEAEFMKYAVELTRVGPIYLWWSEYSDAAVIGPKQGAWGGDNVYRCDACPGWQSDDETPEQHATLHGYYVKFLTFQKGPYDQRS